MVCLHHKDKTAKRSQSALLVFTYLSFARYVCLRGSFTLPPCVSAPDHNGTHPLDSSCYYSSQPSSFALFHRLLFSQNQPVHACLQSFATCVRSLFLAYLANKKHICFYLFVHNYLSFVRGRVLSCPSSLSMIYKIYRTRKHGIWVLLRLLTIFATANLLSFP